MGVSQAGTQVGVGVIGAGRLGRIHAMNLVHHVPSARLTAVSDTNEDAARKLAAEFGVTNVFTDYLRLVENREVQAVIIATPTMQRPQIIKFASEIGKHIFCESPIATTFHDADQAMKWSLKSPAKFQMGHQRRFDPVYTRIKERIEAGEIGNVVMMRSNTRYALPNPANWPDPKVTGGLIIDVCSHDYDLVRWLCRSEVSRVEADGATRWNVDQHTVITNLYLANEVVAQVDASRMATYGYDVRVEIVGTEGAIFMRPDAVSEFRILKGSREAVTTYTDEFDRFKDAYRLEMESFVTSIIKDEETRATAQDGKASVEVAAAAKKSMQEGRAVNLPL